MACLKMRGSTYYAQYYLGSRQKRVCLRTESLQVAKAKMRALESRLAQDGTTGLPTRTPIAEVLTAYVQHIRTVKTAKSAQTDTYYLREAFGPVCDALRISYERVVITGGARCGRDGARFGRKSLSLWPRSERGL